MVDQTPTVTLQPDDTTGAIKQFFKSLFWWQWAITIFVFGVIVVSAVYSINQVSTPKPTPAQIAYKTWHKAFVPVFSKTISDVGVISASLSGNTATTQDFNNISKDALALSSLPKVSNTALLDEISILAINLQQLSSDGVAVYAGGGSLVSFDADLAQTDAQLNKVTEALTSYKK
jgi:hypothetical protein